MPIPIRALHPWRTDRVLLLLAAAFLAGSPSATSGASSPDAPGKRADGLPSPPDNRAWQPVPALSDEFNGQALDPTKWIPRHPSWRGRNSRHEPDNVTVAGGMLRLRSTLRKGADTVSASTVTAACVTSKERNCRPGYYEARIRASDLSMTSAFWFQGKRTEIDVIENVGRPTLEASSWIEDTMMMNTHDFRNGWKRDVATPVRWTMPARARDRFHVFGVWWKNPETVWFYHDGVKVAAVEPGGPFDEPQDLFFDTEVFTWHGWPTREGLLDPDRNTMLVDWVRAWTLVPSDTIVSTETKQATP